MVQLHGDSIKIFNGRGRGGSKQELRDLPVKIRNKISVTDSFLDAENGDFYQREEFGVFGLKGNVGIFNKIKNQKRDVYSRDLLISSNDVTKIRADECVVELALARF